MQCLCLDSFYLNGVSIMFGVSITYSGLTTETLELGMKHVKVNNKFSITTPFLAYFTPCPTVSMVNF